MRDSRTAPPVRLLGAVVIWMAAAPSVFAQAPGDTTAIRGAPAAPAPVGTVAAPAPAGTSVVPAPAGTVSAPAASPVAAAEPGGPRVAMEITVEQDGRPAALGRVVIELHPATAPLHTENFLKLVEEGFYEGTSFHRLVPGFIVQGGDPLSRSDWRSPRLGTGGPGHTVPSEPGGRPVRGAVVGARQPVEVNPELESNGSQFFICLADLPSLEGYSVFGKVVEGMDVVDRIARIRNAGGKAGSRALQRVSMSGLTVLK